MVNAPKSLTRSLGCLGILMTLATMYLTGINQIVYGHFRGESVDEVRFTPDSRLLVGYGNLSTPERQQGTLYAWDVHTGRLRWKKTNPDYFCSFDLSPDGHMLLAQSNTALDIFEVQTGRRQIHLPLPVSDFRGSAFFTRDSKYLLHSPDALRLEVREIGSNNVIRHLNTQITDGAFTLSPDRKHFAFYKGTTLVLRDLKTEKTISKQEVPTTNGAYTSAYNFRFLSDNLVSFGSWVWNPAAKAMRPLNEEDERLEAPDGSCYVSLENRGGKNKHFPVGQLISYHKGQPDVTLEGKTGW